MPKVYEHRLLNTPDAVMNAIFLLPQVFYVLPRVPTNDNVGLNPLYLLPNEQSVFFRAGRNILI